MTKLTTMTMMMTTMTDDDYADNENHDGQLSLAMATVWNNQWELIPIQIFD